VAAYDRIRDACGCYSGKARMCDTCAEATLLLLFGNDPSPELSLAGEGWTGYPCRDCPPQFHDEDDDEDPVSDSPLECGDADPLILRLRHKVTS
jgi:hypothetical protein